MRWPSRSASSGLWVTRSTVRPASSSAARSCRRCAGDRVEGGERLVHQHDRAILHQRAGQGRALAHAAGQRGRQLLRAGARGRRAPAASVRLARGPARSPRSREPSMTLSATGSQGSSWSCCAIRRAGRRAGARRCRRRRRAPRGEARRSGAAGWSCRRRSGRAGRSSWPPGSVKSRSWNSGAPP